ncbi:MAG TPA: DUF6702 family protein [Chitinophagaceae bacterium]|nr:DUF6702 family protein [Chitinophagaceae bacterium]
MVSSVNKWLFIPLLAMVLTSATPHPFHVSVVEVEHNAADKTLEISCKIFTDDFETTLAKNYNAKVDLINPPNKGAMDSLVKKYIYSHLSLRVNGKPAVFNYVGFENEAEAAYGYIQVDNIASVQKIDITNTILFDKFDDQVSIMHIKVNGNRKSTKLNYPDKEASFSF